MNYAVSAGHELTLFAAEEILKTGGNGVDAAIAAYWMSFLSEPCMASAGAGGFAVIGADNQATKMIDFFCQTPQVKKPADQYHFYPVTIDFGPSTEDFYIGRGSSGVPGAIAGIYKMHEAYATMPMKDLASIAMTKAKEGIALNTFQHYDINLLSEIFLQDPKGRSLFFDGDQVKQKGSIIKMLGYADFLETLVIEGPDLFYKGEIAQSITSGYNHSGSSLSMVDFEKYEARIVDVLSIPFKSFQLEMASGPSVGGYILSAYLSFFEGLSRNLNLGSQDHFLALQKVNGKLHLLKNDIPRLIQTLKEELNIELPQVDLNINTRGTSHFNVLDKDGMAVALTTSIGEGNGYFIEGTDMQMNNMLGEGALLPNGYHSWIPNQRLRSMMTPTIIRESGKIKMITGTGGAGRIPFVLAQSIINALHFDLPIEDAVNFPKLYFDGETINVEEGFDFPYLENTKVWPQGSLYFGGTHSILVHNNHLSAVGDKRRYGVASANN